MKSRYIAANEVAFQQEQNLNDAAVDVNQAITTTGHIKVALHEDRQKMEKIQSEVLLFSNVLRK
jgi:hypothetical protein